MDPEASIDLDRLKATFDLLKEQVFLGLGRALFFQPSDRGSQRFEEARDRGLPFPEHRNVALVVTAGAGFPVTADDMVLGVFVAARAVDFGFEHDAFGQFKVAPATALIDGLLNLVAGATVLFWLFVMTGGAGGFGGDQFSVAFDIRMAFRTSQFLFDQVLLMRKPEPKNLPGDLFDSGVAYRTLVRNRSRA